MKAFTAVLGLLVVGSGIAFARPQELSDAEAQRRALDGQDMFDPNPVYTYNYQVANDDEQVYLAQTESRDGAAVSGEYSYVDPLGHLITVTYTANDVDGYTETRVVEENFIQIRAKPVKKTVTASVVEAKSSDSSDLVARIIAQLSPFIKETVATTLSTQQKVTVVEPAPVVTVVEPAPVVTVVEPAPVVAEVVAVESVPVVSSKAVVAKFGTGTGNNIRVETPEYQFATDF